MQVFKKLCFILTFFLNKKNLKFLVKKDLKFCKHVLIDFVSVIQLISAKCQQRERTE